MLSAINMVKYSTAYAQVNCSSFKKTHQTNPRQEVCSMSNPDRSIYSSCGRGTHRRTEVRAMRQHLEVTWA